MRKDGTLRFGDFVAAILHLTVAFGTLTPSSDSFISLQIFTLLDWLLQLMTNKEIQQTICFL